MPPHIQLKRKVSFAGEERNLPTLTRQTSLRSASPTKVSNTVDLANKQCLPDNNDEDKE